MKCSKASRVLSVSCLRCGEPPDEAIGPYRTAPRQFRHTPRQKTINCRRAPHQPHENRYWVIATGCTPSDGEVLSTYLGVDPRTGLLHYAWFYETYDRWTDAKQASPSHRSRTRTLENRDQNTPCSRLQPHKTVRGSVMTIWIARCPPTIPRTRHASPPFGGRH
jgi:hypothetical protein